MREEEKCSKGGRAEQVLYAVWFCYSGFEKQIFSLKADLHFKKLGLRKCVSLIGLYLLLIYFVGFFLAHISIPIYSPKLQLEC